VVQNLHPLDLAMSKRGAWEGVRARLAREQTILVAVVILSFVTGKLGLTLAYGHAAVTLVWPPAGIALGAFVILGYRIWPFILCAALAVYASTIGPLPAALMLAGTGTVEAMLAAYLVNRYAGGRHALQNPRNSLRFAGAVLLASAAIGSTLATLSLVLNGLASWMQYGVLWWELWLGSVTSMVVVAPPVILFSQGSSLRWRTAQFVEGAAALLAVVVVGVLVFCQVPVELRTFPGELLCMPVLLWVTFRLGRRAAAVSLLALGALAIFGTTTGYGPFVRATPLVSLVVVQLFMATTAVMTLSLAALASEYSVAEGQLRELVVTDPLTGLPNYRRLLDVLSMEIARADRHDQPFAVVFFDMDGLKRINDDHGHLIGSRAVCRFAETLRAACRTTDTAARYGGDEFVAVLSETDQDGAYMVVRRIVERLAEDKDQPTLSVSAGVAVYPRDGGTPTTLLSAADRALYAVKADKANARRRNVVGLREWTSGR
jgi:diguanylate cyclase (GGDEF)-like protein